MRPIFPPFLILLFTLCLPGKQEHLLAQPASLSKWLQDWNAPQTPDSIRFKAADRLARRGYYSYKPDSALYYAQALFDFAKARKDKHWMTKALTSKATILRKSGTYEEALDVLLKNIELQEELQNIKGLSNTYKSIGYTLRKLGRFEESLKNDQISLDLAESLGLEGRFYAAATYIEMGSLFMDQEDYEKSLEQYQKSLKLFLELDKKNGIAANYNNIGMLYLSLKEFDQAKNYLLQSLPLKKELNDLEGLGNTYSGLGRIAFFKQQYPEAKKYFEQAFQLFDSINQIADLANTCSALGELEIKTGNLAKAQEWCTRGLEYAEEVGDIEEAARNCDCLYQAYEASSRFDSALHYLKQYKILYDSLFNEENTRKLTKLESEYAYEKEKGTLEAELKQQQLIRNIAIIIGIALLIFAYLMWRLTRIRRKKNEELNRKNEQIQRDKAIISQQATELRAIDAIKSRFFTNISHELRTPLTLIITPISHLLKQQNRENLSSKVQITLTNAYRNAQRLLSLVEELLELSRIEAGEQKLNFTPTRLKSFCQQLFSAFEAKAQLKKIDYQLHTDILESTAVNIDRNRFAKVVNNLLGNALKFTPSGGKVTLILDHSSQEPNTLILTVKDTGRGILPEDLPHIFDRYFQTKNKNIPTEGGTGIGLALSKELAELMGGNLTVESQWEEGSTFILSLPIKETAKKVVPRDAVSEDKALSNVEMITPTAVVTHPATTEGRKKILIVEDNLDMQQLISSLLADRYDYQLASNGEEAWKLLQSEDKSTKDISLIISDIMMPEMDGYELLDCIKGHQKWQRLPVIMLTARATREDKLRALRMGVDDYLSKPFAAEELLARIDNLIQNFEQRQEFQQLGVNVEIEATPSADQEWLSEIEAFCLEGIDLKIEVTTGYLAYKMILSERQLLRRLKSLTGLSTSRYIQEVKLQKARQLLENQTYNTVSEISYACGFNTPSYFTRSYETRYGKRPIEYLENPY
ncbi:MAG: hypothetical protein DHS20C18_51450 [Saprospiraceae bacterium]|nr:MAG: hypothetical protein DHS20C18_51450 [Saprospiraceae bacterium]